MSMSKYYTGACAQAGSMAQPIDTCTLCVHESSVGLSSTTNPSLGVAIPVPAQAHLYTHAKGRATLGA